MEHMAANTHQFEPRFTTRIIELTSDESEDVLSYLFRHISENHDLQVNIQLQHVFLGQLVYEFMLYLTTKLKRFATVGAEMMSPSGTTGLFFIQLRMPLLFVLVHR